MRVLMFGWEFPPFKTGGLGTACYGLTKGLKRMGVDVTFVVPKSIGADLGLPSARKSDLGSPSAKKSDVPKHVKVISAKDVYVSTEEIEEYTHVKLIRVDVSLLPYARPEQHLSSRRVRGTRIDIQKIPHKVERKILVTKETPLGSPSARKSDLGSPSARKSDLGSPSARKSDLGSPSTKKSDLGLPSAKKSDLESPSARKSDLGSPSAKKSNGSAPGEDELYGKSLFEQVEEYNYRARLIAEFEDFDIIHTHDWMTFQAGIQAREVSGKPLVIQIHSTEYDRSGGWFPNPVIHDIEQTGAREADQVITVSKRTKQAVVEKYGIPAGKIDVVYNAVETDESSFSGLTEYQLKQKIVLFLGRITLQKGPDYFVEAAGRVLEKEPDALFVMAGSGDMMHRMIERAGDMNIGHKVLFTGFLRGAELDRIYEMADVYVMPSVSEPFGIAALEAMSHGVPVIISKQSGVSEVVKHALKVNFWNVEELADRIIAVLRYKPLRDMLGGNSKSETEEFSWDNSAIQCMNVYSKALQKTSPNLRSPSQALKSPRTRGSEQSGIRERPSPQRGGRRES